MSALLRSDPALPGAGNSSPVAVAPGSVRVMVVDDSLTVRTVFTRMIDRESDLAIVAQAGSAEQALMTLRSTKVDVILLDLEMPGMGGLEALPKILDTATGAQILVVSSLTADGAEATLSALQMGAAETMLKPRPGGFNEDYRTNLLGKIRALGGRQAKAPKASPKPAPAKFREMKRPRAIAIGSSTGGIHALNLFLRQIPTAFDLPIFITQHLPESFIPVFAKQMESAASGREAVLADENVPVVPRKIYIAPGHGHMTVKRKGDQIVTALAHHPVKSGCRPSVDPMFETLASVYDGHVAGILLSGMGRDGTEGAEVIAAAGGGIYAQDQESCAVWGMPRAVSESGIACAISPPEELAMKVVAAAGAQAWR